MTHLAQTVQPVQMDKPTQVSQLAVIVHIKWNDKLNKVF